MNTKFYTNDNQIPIFEIEYKDGEKFYLMPFRRVNFQVSMNADGFGSAGNSSNAYFDDVRNCLEIGMNHADNYWVKDFPVETMRKTILASAREAVFDHFNCSYGSKHIEEIGYIVKEVYSCNRQSAWNKFIMECYKHFGVNTEWDD